MQEADMKSLARGILVGFAATMFAASAHATIVLDFSGLKDLEEIDGFYNGGTGSLGSSGLNYGISFSSFQACIAPAGACEAATNEPTPPNVAKISPEVMGTMDVAGGFTTGFAVFYTNINASAFATVWSGLDGTGDVLGVLQFPVTAVGASPTPYSNWSAVGLTFDGTAKSVVFDGGGGPDLIAFDNLTLGSDVPEGAPGDVETPEPLTLSLLGAGLAGVAASRRRKAKR
jgi:hypothetical protein